MVFSIPISGNASSFHTRSVSSAVEQRFYTAKVGGSIPSRTTRGYSSVGRAPALQAGCRQFDSGYLHHFRTNSRSKWLPTVNDSKMLGDPINPNHRLHLVKILNQNSCGYADIRTLRAITGCSLIRCCVCGYW